MIQFVVKHPELGLPVIDVKALVRFPPPNREGAKLAFAGGYAKKGAASF